MRRTRKPAPKAVALHYDSIAPPRVIASAEGDRARLLQAAARQQGIPLIQDAGLTEALMGLELDSSIPEELFVAVAVVLSWAYWLTGRRPDDAAAARNPDDIGKGAA